MKVVEESRLCGGTDFGVHIHSLLRGNDKNGHFVLRQLYKGCPKRYSKL